MVQKRSKTVSIFKIPDLQFNFLNFLMVNSKKNKCKINFLKAFKLSQKNNFKNHKNVFKLAIINATPIIAFKELKQKTKKKIKIFPFLIAKKNRLFFSYKLIFINYKKNTIKLFCFINKQVNFIAQKKNLESIKTKNILQNNSLSKKKYLNFRWFF